MIRKQFGLIGYPLTHSFSKLYFTQKFENEGIQNCQYDLFPIKSIDQLPELLKEHPDLVGLNVTIPYKEQVIPYLDEVESAAAEIAAVNTIKIEKGRLIGYNTDVYGFEKSLLNFVEKHQIPAIQKALILGTGGASKAIAYVLKKLKVDYTFVSRTPSERNLGYNGLNKSLFSNIQLIVNTTPLGTMPNTDTFPDIPYEMLNDAHLLFDLVYNPEKTVFLTKGNLNGSHILNGFEMLQGQAEKAWEIWSDLN